MKADVILPAAGTSERMKLAVAKQFLKVLGKHILAYTVDCFHRISWIRHIVVVVNAEQVAFTEGLLESYGFDRVLVCAGSETRHRSIYCGVKLLRAQCSDSDIVIIHDAARPYVSEDIARQISEAAVQHGAAGVTRPLVSTVIQGNSDRKLSESLDRRLYRNSEMPQAFHYGVIGSAYEKCTDEDLDYGTECLLLALKYSQCSAFLVEGTEDLWKVTYQKDLYSMESSVKEKLILVSILNDERQWFPALETLKEQLHSKQLKVVTTSLANTFVVILDKQSCLNLQQSLVSRIVACYNSLPRSATGLDLMVLLVLLRESQLPTTHLQNHSQHLCSSGADCPDHVCSKLECSHQCKTHPTDSHAWSNRRKSEPLSQDSHSEEPDFSLTALGNQTSISNCIVQSFQCPSGMESADSSTVTSPEQSPNGHSFLCDSSYRTVVKTMTVSLQKQLGRKCALVVGVSCKMQSPVGECLADLIWQRSSYLHGQVLRFD